MSTATVQHDDTNKLVRDVLSEVRTLRKEVSLFVPHEKIDDYKNASAIKRALAKARAQYPKYDGHRD